MKLDFDSVGKMLGGLVEQDVPARHQEEALLTLEKEAGGGGEDAVGEEGRNARRGKEQGFHVELYASRHAMQMDASGPPYTQAGVYLCHAEGLGTTCFE